MRRCMTSLLRDCIYGDAKSRCFKRCMKYEAVMNQGSAFAQNPTHTTQNLEVSRFLTVHSGMTYER